MEERLSPPRSKRRKLDKTAEEPPDIPRRCITVYSWNVNGIAPFVQPTITSFFKPRPTKNGANGPPKASLRDFLRRHEWPQLLFLQEVKINPDDSATIAAVKQAVRRQPSDPSDAFDYEAFFCLPNDNFNARGFGRKVYGVCSIVRSDFNDRFVEKVREVEWDVEGRFLVTETKGLDTVPKLAFINVYAVNATDNPYKDPKTGEVIGTRHNRKLQVQKLLQEECKALENRGFGVIIAGDLNIARAPIDGYPNLRTFPKQHCLNREDFEARFFSDGLKSPSSRESPQGKPKDREDQPSLHMVDTFRQLHPTQKSYTYYPRTRNFGESCDRVDLILTSSALKDNLVLAGMHETTSERGPSDHIPLFATLSFRDGSSQQPR